MARQTEKFRQFLNKYQCWGRATKRIHRLFTREFGLSVKTFQRYKCNLKEGLPLNFSRYYAMIKRGQYCFFCEQEENLHIHHLDEDRANNNPLNLLFLCPKCHARLHILYDKLGIKRGDK